MRITAIYAALAALLVLVLAARVVIARNTRKVGLGDGGDGDLARRIRAHANALENLPLALLLLLLLELNQTQPVLLHGLGIALIVARIAHAIGLSRSSGHSVGRFGGTGLTWLVMLAMALLLLWQAFAFTRLT
ncbi:MAPEG family protein [Dokdonella sp.]|uniref:MAPEG family protein n=1 Tax=Dokdonella sp. TaxID=2291710 RepID=UPI001B02944C|nr:MAPEG family protein [Dokdonella sp.]MBO9664927.1 MAPEG family protein [Dokdonella sp.]